MPTKCRAIVVEEKNGPFTVRQIELDDPVEGEVLVKITACGFCHTDATMAKGLLPWPAYPIILGHEGSGIIESVGPGVTKFKAGDRVVISYSFCQECANCQQQDVTGCEIWNQLNFGKWRRKVKGVSLEDSQYTATLLDGPLKGKRVAGSFFGQSSMSEYSIVNEASLIKVGDDVDLALMSPLGCGIQTGAGAVINQAQPKPEDVILVSGIGSVGCSAVMAAKALGCQTIIGVDMVESRLELVKSLGATHTINPKEVKSVSDEVFKITNGKGAKFAIECAGVAPAALAAFLSTGFRGTVVQIGDSGAEGPKIPLGGFLQGARKWQGCIMGAGYTPVFIPQLIDLYQNGKLPLEKITKSYPFEEVQKAIDDMHKGTTIKAILKFA